jgi:hypothetical protein
MCGLILAISLSSSSEKELTMYYEFDDAIDTKWIFGNHHLTQEEEMVALAVHLGGVYPPQSDTLGVALQ